MGGFGTGSAGVSFGGCVGAWTAWLLGRKRRGWRRLWCCWRHHGGTRGKCLSKAFSQVRHGLPVVTGQVRVRP